MAKKKPVKGRKHPAARKVRQNPRRGARVVAKKRKAAPTRPAPPAAPTLGRPKVTGDEDLDMLFREDYHARQIFVFLKVKTLKELEQKSAVEILRTLSDPIKKTVDRIRRFLAERNRCLTGDEEFAIEYKALGRRTG